MNYHFRKAPSGLLLPAELGIPEIDVREGEELPEEQPAEKERVITPEDRKKRRPMSLKKCRKCKHEFQGFSVQQFCRGCLVKMGQDDA